MCVGACACDSCILRAAPVSTLSIAGTLPRDPPPPRQPRATEVSLPLLQQPSHPRPARRRPPSPRPQGQRRERCVSRRERERCVSKSLARKKRARTLTYFKTRRSTSSQIRYQGGSAAPTIVHWVVFRKSGTKVILKMKWRQDQTSVPWPMVSFEPCMFFICARLPNCYPPCGSFSRINSTHCPNRPRRGRVRGFFCPCAFPEDSVFSGSFPCVPLFCRAHWSVQTSEHLRVGLCDWPLTRSVSWFPWLTSSTPQNVKKMSSRRRRRKSALYRTDQNAKI